MHPMAAFLHAHSYPSSMTFVISISHLTACSPPSSRRSRKRSRSGARTQSAGRISIWSEWPALSCWEGLYSWLETSLLFILLRFPPSHVLLPHPPPTRYDTSTSDPCPPAARSMWCTSTNPDRQRVHTHRRFWFRPDMHMSASSGRSPIVPPSSPSHLYYPTPRAPPSPPLARASTPGKTYNVIGSLPLGGSKG
ncbi:hypothetical protein C8R43DRAFT_212945 [Mycena crocata]|nr:hypothetical protein C8R43DRAFT_212945 [Mycena crocata]